MKRRFMTYITVTSTAPVFVEAYTEAEALEMIRHGEGFIDLTLALDPKQTALDARFGLVETSINKNRTEN